jgi:hypothetical protein
MYLKDSNGVVLAVNEQFSDNYLSPNGRLKNKYVGSRDVDFWNKDIGSLLWSYDEEVLNNGKFVDAVRVNPIDGKMFRHIAYVRYLGSIKIGLTGYLLPLK